MQFVIPSFNVKCKRYKLGLSTKFFIFIDIEISMKSKYSTRCFSQAYKENKFHLSHNSYKIFFTTKTILNNENL